MFEVRDVDPGLIIHEAIIENKCSSPGDTGDAVTTPKISRNTDQKQSHERPCFDASTPVSKLPDHHHQICSPTFTNISAIKKKDEHVTNKKDVRRMLATPEGKVKIIKYFPVLQSLSVKDALASKEFKIWTRAIFDHVAFKVNIETMIFL